MRRLTRALVAAGAGLLAAAVARSAYVSRHTERVPYEVDERFDGVELRRYPQAVLAETTAPSQNAAFRRLYRYITGANDGGEAMAMTAPVATRGVGRRLAMTAPVRTRGAEVAMTAPVRVRRGRGGGAGPGDVAAEQGEGNSGDVAAEQGEGNPGDGGAGEFGEGGVTMAFYLPDSYTPESAPVPTDPAVRLVVEPSRPVAVTGFSWWPTDGRVERARADLLEALATRGIEPRGSVSVLQYDPPWTPPFLRTTEVAVGVESS